MPYVDREGTPEHTSHFESCGCAEAREAALRAENERLSPMYDLLCDDYKQLKIDLEVRDARIAELMAALKDARYLLENHASEKHVLERIAAVLKGDAE